MGLNDMFFPTLGMSKNPAVAAENYPPTVKGIATDTTIHKLLPSLAFLVLIYSPLFSLPYPAPYLSSVRLVRQSLIKPSRGKRLSFRTTLPLLEVWHWW